MNTFYKYITKYRLDEHSPVGDLARDIKSDNEFPTENSNKDDLVLYLESCGACTGCMDAFYKAYEDYEAWLKKGI